MDEIQKEENSQEVLNDPYQGVDPNGYRYNPDYLRLAAFMGVDHYQSQDRKVADRLNSIS